MWVKRRDMLRGLIIYSLGDGTAAAIIGEFVWSRLFGMMAVGGLLYGLEVPAYLRWIDRIQPKTGRLPDGVKRAGLAMVYFNPIWIARHILLIKLCSGEWHAIHWGILMVAVWSFLANLPISMLANFTIQNHVAVRYRFMASASFSMAMAIYFAWSERLFG